MTQDPRWDIPTPDIDVDARIRAPVHVGGTGVGYLGTATIAEINALAPAVGDAVVAEDAGTPAAAGSAALVIGDLAEYQGAVLGWQVIVAAVAAVPASLTRAIVATTSALVVGGGLVAADRGKIAQWHGGSLLPAILESPPDGVLCGVRGEGSVFEGTIYVFDGTVPTGTWRVILSTPSGAAGGVLTGTYPNPTDLNFAGQARGQVLVRGAAAWGGQAVGVAGQMYTSGGPGADNYWSTLAIVLPTGYVAGLEVAWSTSARVTISAGKCRNSADSYDIVNAAPVTVDITVAGANGLDTGAEAVSTWYAVYVIAGAAVATAGLLVAGTAVPTLPAGYTVYRRVSWVYNDGAGDFTPWLALGSGSRRTYKWMTAYTGSRRLIAGSAVVVWTLLSCAVWAPPTCRWCRVMLWQGTNNRASQLSVDGATATAGLSCGGAINSAELLVPLTAAQALYYMNSGGAGTLSLEFQAWEDSL